MMIRLSSQVQVFSETKMRMNAVWWGFSAKHNTHCVPMKVEFVKCGLASVSFVSVCFGSIFVVEIFGIVSVGFHLLRIVIVH